MMKMMKVMMMGSKKFILKPRANTDLTVRISGIATHDQGDNPDVLICHFSIGRDFAAWLELAIKAMEDKTAISIDHHFYNSYEMIPEEIIIGGQIRRKMSRVYLPISSAERN